MAERHNSREYALWKAISEGGSRSAEWWGRIRAARTTRETLAVVARAPMVNLEQLRGNKLEAGSIYFRSFTTFPAPPRRVLSGPGHPRGPHDLPQGCRAGNWAECPRDYLIFVSLKATCLRATGSYFLKESLSVAVLGFFLVT